MNLCQLIEHRVRQFTSYEIKVTVLRAHPTYTLRVKQDETGAAADPQSLIRRAIPKSHPFSGVGTNKGWFDHSFYCFEAKDIPSNYIPTNHEIWGLVLHSKRSRPNIEVKGKLICDWDSQELEEVLYKHLTSDLFHTPKDQDDYFRSRVALDEKEKYGSYWKAMSAYWKEFTATYKTWGEIEDALQKDSEYLKDWQANHPQEAY